MLGELAVEERFIHSQNADKEWSNILGLKVKPN